MTHCLCLAIGFVCATLAVLGDEPQAKQLLLAQNGRTDYRIVVPKNADELKEAANDLRETLTELAGADFSPGKDREKTRCIYIGIPSPNDKEPLAQNERRITTCDGDIYLYGNGRRANESAVYDFQRDVLGCRWYTVNGDRRIPRQEPLALPELKRSLIPSIPFLTARRATGLSPWNSFARKIGLYEQTDLSIGQHIHAGQRIIPSGLVPFEGRRGNTFGPLKYFIDCKYFQEHPEYYSMDSKGRRVITMQLCYSNMAMRDEYVRNIIHMLEQENYQGGQFIVGVGQDDNGGTFCYCPNCEALEKKYEHPAGAYYDFLLDISARFAKTHPDILLCFLAYRAEQTLSPSRHLGKLPSNLLPSYAPLGADFSKPFDHPSNSAQLENFKQWADIASRMHWWAYPTTYPRPIVSFPMIANIHRIAANFRIAHRNKVTFAFCEFGYGPYCRFGFNDLRLYLLSELCRNIDADEQAVIRDFTDGCYGPAAQPVRDFLAELERLEAGFPFFLRWNPDILSITYATPENLLRWQNAFDKMENLAGDDMRILGNLRRLRFFLDQQTIAAWPYIPPEQQQAFGDLETIIARAEKTIVDDTEALNTVVRKGIPNQSESRNKVRIRYLHTGLDQYIFRARGGKPLPAELARKKAYRILPNRNKLGLDLDSEAPFGLCNTGVLPGGNLFIVRSYDNSRKPKWINAPVPRRLTEKRLQRSGGLDGKYHYHYLGAMPIEHDMQVFFGPVSPSSGFAVGHLFEPGRPKRLFDFHVCLAADSDKRLVKIGELVVIPREDEATDDKANPKNRLDHAVNEFL